MKKENKVKQEKKKAKRMKSIFFQSILYLSIAIIIVIIFAAFDFGKSWDELKEGSKNIIAQITLISFRLLLYFLPAFIGFFIRLKKNKPFNKDGRISLLIDCYNIQFFSFSTIVAIYNLLALDYLYNLDILDKIDNFVLIIGLLVSLFLKKEIPNKQIEVIDKK